MGPVALRSPARTGSPLRSWPMTMRARRVRRSARPEARARMAMISDAAVMRKPLERLLSSRCFLSGEVTLRVMLRRARSFMSSVRGQVMAAGSRSRSLPWKRCESMRAASKIVRGGDGVKVSVEVEVDLFRGLDLGAATAGCAAFHAEDGAEGGFARGEDGSFADGFKALDEADGGDGLAFSGDCWSGGSDEDHLAVAVEARVGEDFEAELGAEWTAFFVEVFGFGKVELGGNCFNRQQRLLHLSPHAGLGRRG